MIYNSKNAATRLAGAAIAMMAVVGAPALAQRAPTTDDKVVTIRNTGKEPLKLGALQFPEGFARGAPVPKGCGAILPAGESCQISIRFVPTHVGEYSGELTMDSGDPQNPYLIEQLTGTGVAPAGGARGHEGGDDARTVTHDRSEGLGSDRLR